jgi:hypothetical protein
LWQTNGMKEMHRYEAPQVPTHDRTAMKTVWLIRKRKIGRPAKNRNTDRWRRPGSASTTQRRCRLSTPFAKYARTRARLSRLRRVPVTRRYRRAHCCNNVAISAHVRLMIRLRNHSTLTQMDDEDGLKVDGSERVGGRGRMGPFELPAWAAVI